MLRSASINMSLTNQVTTEMISVLQGIIVILIASPMVWTTIRNLWKSAITKIESFFDKKAEVNATQWKD